MASQVIVFYEDVAQKSVLQDMQVAALLPLTKKTYIEVIEGVLQSITISGQPIWE